jgi:adenosylhomocysteine nucleosidase
MDERGVMRFFPILAALALPAAAHAQKLDETPRTVVMTAYQPEYNALEHAVSAPTSYKINGITFLIGTLSGKPVILMQSGISMVNAAMTTQLVLDRFAVTRIVFSGIAGGVDPALSIGDVIVPEAWGQYLEANFARTAGGGWKSPEPVGEGAPENWNFVFPRGTTVLNAHAPIKRAYLLPVDPELLALARKVVPTVKIDRCVEPSRTALPETELCLHDAPRVLVGGTGVSAGIYADNADFRIYLQKAWHARVLDMESAAVVQVAYANEVPVIVFRSLSDLAGGDATQNMENTFEHLAAVNSARVVRAYISALPN